MAIAVNTPNTGATAAGWLKEAPFRISAWKQPISVCEVFEKKRKVAYPSKSGITRAMSGMPPTSFCDTGMMASALMGVLAFIGHKLPLCQYSSFSCGRQRFLPLNIGIARIEDHVKLVLAVCIDGYIQHNALISDIRHAVQVKEHGHVVRVVRRVKIRNID